VIDADKQSPAGVSVCEGVVRPEWIDINGHMNVAYYILAFDLGVDELWARAGITDNYITDRKMSTFAVESHVVYRAELKESDPFRIETQILAIDDKRLHQFQRLYHATEGFLAATAEWLNLHVSLETRRVCPWPDDILEAFMQIGNDQVALTLPLDVGKRMLVRKPAYAMKGYNSTT